MIYNTNSSGIPGVYDTVGGDTPQLLKINGDQLSITNGNSIALPTPTPAYLSYVALCTFPGPSNEPVITAVLENTLGGIPVWTKTGTGAYTGTLAGTFTVGKTITHVHWQNTQDARTSVPQVFSPTNPDANRVVWYFSDNNDGSYDMLYPIVIEIKVYP